MTKSDSAAVQRRPSWPATRLKWITRLAYGESLPAEKRDPSGAVPVFGSNGVVGTHSKANTGAPLIVVGRKGSFGKITWSGSAGFCIDTTYFCDPGTTTADLRWLYYALQTLGLDEVSLDTGVPGLARESAYDGTVPLPSPPSQRAIANFLDRKTKAIDDLMRKKERLIQLLEEKRQVLVTQAVTKGLDPSVPMKDSGVPWLGEIPAHWEVKRLKQISSRVVVGIAQAATHAYADSGIPIVRSTNVRPNRIALDDLLFIDESFANQLSSKYINPGDLLTVRTGNAGITAVVPKSLPRSQCFTMLITTLRPMHSPAFFSFQLNSNVGRVYFALEGWGTAQANISVPILQNVPVAVPPPNEQLDIVESLLVRLGQIETADGLVSKQMETLREYRQSLISAAVTGQINVTTEAAA